MIKNLPKKLYSTLIVLILSLCVHTTNAQQVVILNHTVPSAATSCTNSTIAVDGRINCNNFVHVGNTQSVVGNTILCNIEYSAGPICTPAFGFFSYTFDFPSLSSGNYNVEIRTYLNGVVQDLETDAFNVISCCAATASFTANMTNKCTVDTDTFMFTNTSTGSISQEWYINDVLTSTSTDFAPDLTAIGSYSIRLNVSDGSCTDSVTQTVSVHQTPSVDLGPDIVACVNTFETLDAGAGQSSYAWNFTGSNSQTVNITNTGSYNVVVTNPQGCTATDTIEAVFNPLPVVDLGADTAICENVGLTLDAGNHQSYLWSNAASTQTIEAGNGGQFTVEVTDTNACQNTDDITVTLIVSPTIDLGADSATICPGDSLVLDAGAQTSYLWNTGDNTQNISANSNQLYFVEVTNVNNCTASDSVYLDFFANPVVDLGTDQSICFGENASFDAGSFASYLWSDNSTMQTLSLDSTAYVLGQNTISVTVLDQNNCSGEASVSIDVLDCATGIQNIPFTSEVSIYPNPTSNSILIDIEKSIEELTITLFDLSGKTIFETAYSNVQQLTLDLVELNNGLYFLELRNGQEVEIQKISKK